MIRKNKLNITESQKKKCHAIIHSHATACGGVGAAGAQIPLADNAVITPIQIAMIIELGLVFNQNITKSVAQSIISGASASLIGRGISQVLVGWIPGVGNAINTATAAGLTEAIGWIAVDKFSKDEYFEKDTNKESEKSTTEDNAQNSTSSDSETEQTADNTREQEQASVNDELISRADEFIQGKKKYIGNEAEYSKLLSDIEKALRNESDVSDLQKKYDKLAKIFEDSLT